MAYSNINKPNEYFNTVLYSGDGNNNRTIIGVGFNPDMSWVKSRNNAVAHIVADIVRGSNKNIVPNETVAEFNPTTDVGSGGIGQVTTDGFTCVQGTSSLNNTNASGYTYVAWNWLAGGTGVSNTDGSITSTVSANTTAGFSIVKFTSGAIAGYSVGHGLGTTPSVIIQKITGTTGGWLFCHKDMSASGITSGFLQLQTTDAFTSNANVFTNVNNSTVTQGSVISNNYEQIMYCFAEKKGYSKFGSYTGNGNADGTFVYTGFKPAMIILKNASDTYNWEIRDDKRRTYNEANENRLFPNLSNAESVNTETIDFLSNGFKIRNAGGGDNGSGNTIIYMAFAENPLVAGNYVPTTAR